MSAKFDKVYWARCLVCNNVHENFWKEDEDGELTCPSPCPRCDVKGQYVRVEVTNA